MNRIVSQRIRAESEGSFKMYREAETLLSIAALLNECAS
jgi:hypothetical protein